MSAGATDVRKAFERWFSDEGTSPRAIARSGDGYVLMQAQSAWVAWQAAWSARDAGVSELIEALQVFVSKYDSAPDGDLGVGLVNGDFYRARAALARVQGGAA